MVWLAASSGSRERKRGTSRDKLFSANGAPRREINRKKKDELCVCGHVSCFRGFGLFSEEWL